MIYIGMLFVAIIGTLLHFTYEWSGHNKIVAIFSAVNESTWEHIKICMTPTIIWSLYDWYMNGGNANFFIGKAMSLLTIIIMIPVLFYAYTFFTKKSILWVDVICFYITVICSTLVFHHFINMEALPSLYTYLSYILLLLEMGVYLTFTFHPLKNFIFEDPTSHKYGLSGHTEMDHHNHKH